MDHAGKMILNFQNVSSLSYYMHTIHLNRAFAATATIESHIALSTGLLFGLSTQQVYVLFTIYCVFL